MDPLLLAGNFCATMSSPPSTQDSVFPRAKSERERGESSENGLSYIGGIYRTLHHGSFTPVLPDEKKSNKPSVCPLASIRVDLQISSTSADLVFT